MIRKSCRFVLLIALLMCFSSNTASAQTLTTLHLFNGNDGSYPNALIQGDDHNFYGTTLYGGTSIASDPQGYGTVFKITPAGALNTLVNFNITNGENPQDALVLGSDGNFYGTTQLGGTGTGTVFKMTPAGTLTILHNFGNFGDDQVANDGVAPYASLVQGNDGNFYGTTSYSDVSSTGTVFKVAPDGALSILYSFTGGSDGSFPSALILGNDGNFYGTTSQDNASNMGTVFKVTPAGKFTTLYNFSALDSNGDNDDGAFPGILVSGNDGNFYGTTVRGGALGLGTVFKVTPAGALTTLITFGTTNGEYPSPALVSSNDGNFYGTTEGNDLDDYGSVFQVTPAGVFTTLYRFMGGSDGGGPSSLIQGRDGNFYGTTYGFGSLSDYGTVFQFSPGGLQAFDANYQFTGVDLSDQNVGNLGGGAVTSARPVTSKTPNAQPNDTPSGPIPLFDYATFHDIKGAVADGTTKVLLQYTAPSSGKVTFVETDGVLDASGNPADHLRDVYDLNPPVGIQTGTVGSDHVAFAVYTVPESLDTTAEAKSNPGMAVTHTVHFQVLFTPDGSSTVQQSALMPITLQSPPVLLVHGIWGKAELWANENNQGALYTLQNNGFDTYVLDYENSNNAAFFDNRHVLLHSQAKPDVAGAKVWGIDKIFDFYRNQSHVAITKVDVVAHSMGGIVTREFVQSPEYTTTGDFHDGYIRRFITIGTPHLGSPQAPPDYDISTSPILPLQLLWRTASAYEDDPYGPAIEDLQPGSDALKALEATPLPSFAEIGDSTEVDQNLPETENLKTLNCLLVNFGTAATLDYHNYDSDLFGGSRSDLVVTTSSQQGGLDPKYTTTTPMLNHLIEKSSPIIADDVSRLLAGPLENFSITGFPAPSSVPNAHKAFSFREQEPNVQPTSTPFVTITSPTIGQSFASGNTINVNIVPNSGTTLAGMAIEFNYNPSSGIDPLSVYIDSAILAQGPYAATFTVPPTASNNMIVTVVAEDTSGNVCSVPVDISLTINATVQGFVVPSSSQGNNAQIHRVSRLTNEKPHDGTSGSALQLPPVVLTSQGSTYQLDIIASFSDGVNRNVTPGSTGTVYVSSDATVATVSADGLITAVADGNAVVTVTNGSATAVANIAVNFGVPSILSITPAFGALGASVPVTITGYDLGGASAVQVLLNGVADSKITVTNIAVTAEGTTLTADVNIAANALPGMRTFVVTTPGGTSDASAPFDAAGFTVSPSAPTITGFTPASGPVGTNVTISGTGFATATAVTFNGTTATFTLLSDTSIFTTVPSGAATGKISITNAGGTIVSAMPFTVAMPPTITSFTPTSGPVGTVVTITGTNLTGVTRVRFHNASAVTYSANAGGTQIMVTVPSGAATGTITVNTPGGQVTSSQTFTVTAATSPPTITGISPTSGTAGTVVTITGTNLTGTTSVTINGVSVAFTVVNGTTITFTVPAGITGGVISITTPGGTVTSGTITFTLLTWNSKDVAAASDGTARMLWTRSDGAAGIWIMSASDTQTAVGPAYGPFPGWSAKAVSVAGDGTSRVLWTNTNGQAGVWSFNAQGTKTTIGTTYGPFAGWTATDIATAPNGTSRVLWTNTNGQAGVWSFSAADVETTVGTTYGPFTGWTAKAVGASGDGTARVLWTNTNGQAGVWSFNAADVETVIGRTYGPYTGWSAKDLGTSSDGTSNVLWTNVSGAAGVWTFSANDAETAIGPTYGPYPGYTAASLDAANDQSRVLWVNASRAAGLWTFGANDAESVIGSVYGPF